MADGTLSRYKARLVANGSIQFAGIDVEETFSPVVKPGTIKIVLSLASSQHWPVHQLDIKNAFLHGDLSEMRSLYGLKQALQAWFQRFASYVTRVGFHHSRCGSSLFIYRYGINTAYLLLYVDDIVLMLPMRLFMRDSLRVFLSQRKYATKILERAHMVSCNSMHQVCLYMHDPREPHFSALKRILRYVHGTLDYGLQLFSSFSTDLVAYSNANWAGCPTTRRSTLATNYSLGPLSVNQRFLVLVHRRSIVVLPLLLLKLVVLFIYPLPGSASTYEAYRDRYSFVRDLVVTGQVRVLHVPSRYQYANIFTKDLPSALFEEFCTSLSVWCPSL
ncbi:ribonuclease H-like domain-containing protein [Tanacetum coccineum]